MTLVDAVPDAVPDAGRLPFFVYGTLRPGAPNHARFLDGRTRAEEPARLTGAVLYPGPGYPYAVEDPAGVVTGDLVTARPETYADLLATLDRLEEYAPGDPRNLYDRVAMNVVRVADGSPVRAWVYVAAPAVAAGLRARATPIEGGEWRPAGPTAPPPPPPAPRTP
ncbi:gamma-glutamylcyclotransferase family protein [Streptomyces sp. G6]|uniref:gamma-glutamylcyclotransferase family protein n=1 Tax=Streptomyces sp. G6 TaxID=1178736 RepID=UPI003EDA5452